MVPGDDDRPMRPERVVEQSLGKAGPIVLTHALRPHPREKLVQQRLVLDDLLRLYTTQM